MDNTSTARSSIPWTISALLAIALITVTFRSRSFQAPIIPADVPPEHAATPPPAAVPTPDPEVRRELMLLRAEVNRLRTELAEAQARLSRPNAMSTMAQPPDASVLDGNTNSWRALNSLAADLKANRGNPTNNVLRKIREKFQKLGETAALGNHESFLTLWRATRVPGLAGLAAEALGNAAASGHEQALAILLNSEHYGILKSSAVGALVSVAQNGNEPAIQVISDLSLDSKTTALWGMAINGLAKPAESGHSGAIDAIARMAVSTNKNIREPAIRALERAAFNQQELAMTALRTLTPQ